MRFEVEQAMKRSSQLTRIKKQAAHGTRLSHVFSHLGVVLGSVSGPVSKGA